MEGKNDKPEISKRSQEFHAAINEHCLPRIERATVPILGVQNDKIVHDRTGVLYQVGTDHFVLTAAHDLREIVQQNIPLYLSANVKDVDPIPLTEARFISTETDDRDVGVIWIPPSLADEVKKHRQFLYHHQVNLEPIKHKTPYLFFGYPMDWSARVVAQNHIQSMGLGFSTFPHKGSLHSTAIFRDEVHMALIFTREAIAPLANRQDYLPKVNGMSGCGVWQVGDWKSGSLKACTDNTLSLVGIQHTWYPDLNYVQATRIGYPLALINEYYPNTNDPMRLVYRNS